MPDGTVPEGMRRTLTDIGGVSMYVLAAGPDVHPDVRGDVRGDVRAVDVVVVPGLGGSRYLRPSVAATGHRGVRCWLVDPPGFGRSGNSPAYRPPTVPGLAAAVVAWLDARADEHAGVDRLVLVGHSSGAQVAARAVAQLAARGDTPARLVLASPTVDPAFRSLPRLLARCLADSRREPRSLIRTQFPEWRRAGPRRLLGLLRAIRAEDELAQVLTGVSCPVTVVRGGDDPLNTPEWALRLADGPDRDLIELLGLPHAFPYVDPDRFADVLTSAGREAETNEVITALPTGHPARTGLHVWDQR